MIYAQPLTRSRFGRAIERAAWTAVHDLLAHPICGVLWIAQLKRAGDRLHEWTLPPISWRDQFWNVPPATSEDP